MLELTEAMTMPLPSVVCLSSSYAHVFLFGGVKVALASISSAFICHCKYIYHASLIMTATLNPINVLSRKFKADPYITGNSNQNRVGANRLCITSRHLPAVVLTQQSVLFRYRQQQGSNIL